MTKSNQQKEAQTLNKKLRFSIVWKLNAGQFVRLLSAFLALDLILAAAWFSMLLVRAEETAAEAAQMEIQYIPARWSALSGIGVIEPQELGTLQDGGDILALQVPQESARYLILPPEWKGTERAWLGKRLAGLLYVVEKPVQESTLLIVLPVGEGLGAGGILLAVAGIFEMLILISSLVQGAREIRRTLQPIEELAETAQTLGAAAQSGFSPEDMEALAGKLAGINAARLDTRIAVDGTQEELRRLAEAINAMLSRINAAYRAQVRFVSDASHELRTPISVLQGYANMLDRWGKNDPKVLDEAIAAIREEAANMKELVEQLLFLARGDNNTMTLEMESFDLGMLASEVVRELRMIDGGHEFEAGLACVMVSADEGLIKQALRILTDNAVKYTPPGGHIRVSVAADGRHAHIHVQDDGIGIPEEALPRIFERFYRAEESRARATGGAGLGLSIAQWIVHRHGGHLEVISREGIGTRFTVVLPLPTNGSEGIGPTQDGKTESVEKPL